MTAFSVSQISYYSAGDKDFHLGSNTTHFLCLLYSPVQFWVSGENKYLVDTYGVLFSGSSSDGKRMLVPIVLDDSGRFAVSCA